jgi:endonuclease-3 related protein
MGRVLRSGRRRRPEDPLRVYRLLLGRFGHAGWWPGDTPFEVCLGAILTQNTAWTNVEKALARVRAEGRLSFEGLKALPLPRLEELLRPSGTYRVKARRVRAFLSFLESRYGGRVEAMASTEPEALRRQLLEVDGIGPETADSIALFAAGKALFVVDAYTRRVFGRLGWLGGGETYDEVQQLFHARLPSDAALFNDYHAQVVRLAKEHCRKRPQCPSCPLEDICPRRGLSSAP